MSAKNQVGHPLFRATAEALVGVIMLALINLGWFPEDPGMIHVQPHPSLFLALIIAGRHGFGAGVITATLCALEHWAIQLNLINFETYFDVLAPPYATPLLILAPAVLMLGSAIATQRRQLTQTQLKLQGLELRGSTQEETLQQLQDSNARLASQLVMGQRSLSTMHRLACGLVGPNRESILAGLARLAGEAFEGSSVSVWLVDGERSFHRVAAVGPRLPGERLKLQSEHSAYFDEKGVLEAVRLPKALCIPGLPLLTGRLRAGEGGRVLGYLCIDALSFLEIDRSTRRDFSILVAWATQALKATEASEGQEASSRSAERIADRPPLSTRSGSTARLTPRADSRLRHGQLTASAWNSKTGGAS